MFFGQGLECAVWEGTQHVEVTNDWIAPWTWWVSPIIIFRLFTTEEQGDDGENEDECESEKQGK